MSKPTGRPRGRPPKHPKPDRPVVICPHCKEPFMQPLDAAKYTKAIEAHFVDRYAHPLTPDAYQGVSVMDMTAAFPYIFGQIMGVAPGAQLGEWRRYAQRFIEQHHPQFRQSAARAIMHGKLPGVPVPLGQILPVHGPTIERSLLALDVLQTIADEVLLAAEAKAVSDSRMQPHHFSVAGKKLAAASVPGTSTNGSDGPTKPEWRNDERGYDDAVREETEESRYNDRPRGEAGQGEDTAEGGEGNGQEAGEAPQEGDVKVLPSFGVGG